MSKVSTRPQKITTPAAAPAQHVPGALPAVREDRAQARRTLCTELAALLGASSQTDEEEMHSANSARLLRIASERAKSAAQLGWHEREPEDTIWDVAALMSAAARVPGDVAGPERNALVSEAWARLLLITGSESRADVDDEQMIRTLPSAEQAGKDTAHILLNGYNARQVTTMQEEIATRAASLGEWVRDLRDELGPSQSDAMYWPLNGVADMADMIGLLADALTGGAIKGDAAAWLIGPNFAGEGKARFQGGAA
jgi:hypothetical protein